MAPTGRRNHRALSRLAFTFFVLLPSLLFSNTHDELGVPPAYEGDLPSLSALNIRNALLEVLVDDLVLPRAFEIIGPREVLLTEIHGRLLRVDLDTGEQIALQGVPEFVTDHPQTGLIDVALHPRFTENRRIYFTYVERDPQTGRYFTLVLATALLGDSRLSTVETLLSVEPYGWSPSNFGGVMAFDEAGLLYLTVGDRSEDGLAQRGDRLEGKVLRLHDDGTVPADNPFVGNSAVDDRIYALGVRNAQGLVFDSDTGRLYEAEHGPLGGDEVNVIKAGANYGWPLVSYGLNYTTAPIGEGTHRAGTEQPLFYYVPSEAISTLTQYRGDMFFEWDGDLLVGALKGAHISKLDLQGDQVRSESPLLGELGARVRDVKVHRDGSIWVLLQDGRLLRLYRDGEPEPLAPTGNPADIYALVCSGCHDVGANDAPLPDDTAFWSALGQEPREALYERVIKGFGAMPARGLCNICNDDHLRATTDYMISWGDAEQ